MTIGRHAFLGAGSVVTRDVLDHGLVYGVPAVLTGWTCECGVRLLAASGKKREAFLGAACGLRYRKSGEGSG